jgi:hypothetical protein
VAYLAIFFLCFCGPEEASALCFYLLELKSLIMDSSGLVDAYVKALGLSIDPKVKTYIKQVGNRFTSALTINYAHISSSIYVIDKIINRRKIEEAHMFLVLSADVIREMIANCKDDPTVINVLVVRHCTPNAVSIKYRQAAAVNSATFMKDEDESSKASLSVTDAGRKEHSGQPSWKTSSFHSELKPLNESPPFDKPLAVSHKKMGDSSADSIDEPSIGMISMIEEMKDLQRPP